MDIIYHNGAIEKICTVQKYAAKKHGQRNAELINQRLQQIEAADNLAILCQGPGRCHPLHNDRNGQYSMDLDHPKRLILLPEYKDLQRTQALIGTVRIIEIVDYH